jgi:NAD(P)-dependent dehydrogenase (short-subunit alcohol dehydrogenase family)
VTADPLSAQVHSQAHAWGALPKHLKAASIVGRAISELQHLKAQPNEGISTMLAGESKRTGKYVRELEHELFSQARPPSIIQRFSEPQEIAAVVVYACSDLVSSATGAALRVEGGIVTGLG